MGSRLPKASAHSEHGGGLALVFLLLRLEDGNQVLEGGPEGGLGFPAVLHEEIDLAEEKRAARLLLPASSVWETDRAGRLTSGGHLSGRGNLSPCSSNSVSLSTVIWPWVTPMSSMNF